MKLWLKVDKPFGKSQITNILFLRFFFIFFVIKLKSCFEIFFLAKNFMKKNHRHQKLLRPSSWLIFLVEFFLSWIGWCKTFRIQKKERWSLVFLCQKLLFGLFFLSWLTDLNLSRTSKFYWKDRNKKIKSLKKFSFFSPPIKTFYKDKKFLQKICKIFSFRNDQYSSDKNSSQNKFLNFDRFCSGK